MSTQETPQPLPHPPQGYSAPASKCLCAVRLLSQRQNLNRLQIVDGIHTSILGNYPNILKIVSRVELESP